MDRECDDDIFLKELQKECLKDKEEVLNTFREALNFLEEDSESSLKKILGACHNLKGNLQAVGLLHCSQFVHKIEDVLSIVSNSTMVDRSGPQADDLKILEFFLSQALIELEHYLEELENDLVDNEEKLIKHSDFFMVTQGWALLENNDLPKNQDPPVEDEANIREVLFEGDDKFEVRDDTNNSEELLQLEANENSFVQDSDKVDQTKAKEIDGRPLPFLLCKEGESFFAFDIQNIEEIIIKQKMNDLPYPQDKLKGLINFRGEILPILNMDSILIKSQDFCDKRSYIIISNVNKNRFGFEIENVLRVVTIGPKMLKELDRTDSELPPTTQSLLTNIALVDEKSVLVLDLNKCDVA